MPFRTLFSVALLTAVPLATESHAASTWIVDEAGGSGHHFRAIQAAVNAAADGDTVLVRRGTYDEQVLVDGKGLFVVALPGTSVFGVTAAVTPAPLFHVRNLPATSVFEMRGLQFMRLSGTAGDVLHLENCAGRVWIQEAFLDTYDGVALRISSCSEVMLSGVLAQSNTSILDAQGSVRPAHGMLIERSRVRVFECSASGSHGPPIRSTPSVAIPGGAALRVLDSVVDLTSVDLRGGSGGVILAGNCVHGAIGGAGLEVEAPLGLPTAVSVRAGRIDAGISGPFDANCAPSPGTAPSILDPHGAVTRRSGTPRTLIWPATPFQSGNFEFRLYGEPRDLYLVLLSLDAMPALALSGADGDLFLPLVSSIVGFHGQLNQHGWVAHTTGFAPIGQTIHVHVQAVLLDAAGGAWLSNPAAITFF